MWSSGIRFIPVILMFLAIGATSPAIANDTAKQSDEVNVLGRFVGTWDMDLTVKPIGGDVIKAKKTEVRTWSLGGAFVRFEDAQAEGPDTPEFHLLMTYDPITNAYPGFMMVGTVRTLVTGSWDASTSTMTFEGKSPDDGNAFVFKTRFVDGDSAESTAALTNAEGDVFLELASKQARRTK